MIAVPAILDSKSKVDADLALYLGSLTTALSSGQVALLNTFVTDLKTGLGITNLSDAFDVMYIMANETEESGLKNLVKRSHDAETVNTPAFTTLQGFTSDGSTSYINTNYNPALSGVNFTLNNASIGVYIRTNVGEIASDIGVRTSGDTIYLYTRYSNNRAYFRINNASDGSVTPITDSRGFSILSRVDSTSVDFYKNKSYSENFTLNSTEVPNNDVYILCTNRGGPEFFSSKETSFAFMGKSFSSVDIDIIVDAFESYMDANGKGVIT